MHECLSFLQLNNSKPKSVVILQNKLGVCEYGNKIMIINYVQSQVGLLQTAHFWANAGDGDVIFPIYVLSV